MRVLPRTAKRFHELLLNTTMRAKTSFLTSVDAGTTLNRFSQDLELIDNDLPMSIDQTIFQFFSVIVSAVFVFMGSGYVSAAIPFCILAIVLIQFYYLRTSRQLRLLDIEAKAPLFSHFLDTNNGLSCIRAYGWTQSYMERHYEALNTSQKPYYLLWCIQRWLTLVLDLLNAGVAILLVSVACTTQTGSTGFLGVALFNIVTFGSTLQSLVSQWTHLETALGAIARTRWYVSNVKDENLPDEGGEAPQGWPGHGTITFKAVSASYDSSVEPVLKDISFSISEGERIAICGRTGSGKSSLISTLARLLEITSGTISIDDIDISRIPREEVRKRLNTLPQEPFFLHGSVRENVDPQEIASDEVIVGALRAVGIWELFESSGGLAGRVNEDKLSHGQRQLFCLARAIVNPARILIIDEATSSIDSDTDMLIQRVFRDRFQGRTVIAVAHKLDTVLDFDRVIVLDKGRIVEVGNPQELLTMLKSAFYALYHSVSQVDG
ncbi:putative ABC transporter C family member 5 [Ilyonectria destructans]|nr:putative ABC transporter C family member 5 [Ilyonectria destructans]